MHTFQTLQIAGGTRELPFRIPRMCIFLIPRKNVRLLQKFLLSLIFTPNSKVLTASMIAGGILQRVSKEQADRK